MNLMDVTDEYIKAGVINFDIDPGFANYKVAYLCVYDVSGWQPVAITEIKNNNILFTRIGPYVMYLPAIYDHGKYMPVGVPFYVDSLNYVRRILRDQKTRQDPTIIRKSPLYSYTAYHVESLKGGKFEAANASDFKNAVTLYEINNYPFYMNSVRIANKKAYRYLRYVAPPVGSIEADNIAEIEFYGKDNNRKLNGKYMGIEGATGHEIAKAFDNNIETFYQNATNKNGWIGIDLGEENVISEIKFCPRNDTNCVMPGNDYELFYWDNRWISLGSKKALDYTLSFKNCPVGVLFWLKCKTGGHEERIFTIEDGTQKFW